jgi:hypothetical protein
MSIIGAVLGVSEVAGAIISTGVKLAVGARQVDDDAAQRMVNLMKGRVSQDTGRLYNGITAERIEDGWKIQASAIDPSGRSGGAGEGADYASFEEYGTVYNDAHPYFWPSVQEVLPERELAMRRILDGVEQ